MRNKRILFFLLFLACLSLSLSPNISVARAGFRARGVSRSFRARSPSNRLRISRRGSYTANNGATSPVNFFTELFLHLALQALVDAMFNRRNSKSYIAGQNQILPESKQRLLSGKLINGLDVNKAFLALQNAWMQDDISLARQYITTRLEANLAKMLEEMGADFEVNIMNDIKLLSANVLHISQTDIWLSLSGTMVDYTMNALTNEVVKGTKDQADTFHDVWRFKKVNGV